MDTYGWTHTGANFCCRLSMSRALTRVWVIRVCLGELVLLVLLMRGGGGSPGLTGGQRYLRGKIESKLNGIKIRYISTLFRGHQRRESFSSKRWCTTDTRQNMGARASASRPGVCRFITPSACGLMSRSRHRYDHTILPHVHVVDTSRTHGAGNSSFVSCILVAPLDLPLL